MLLLNVIPSELASVGDLLQFLTDAPTAFGLGMTGTCTLLIGIDICNPLVALLPAQTVAVSNRTTSLVNCQ